MNPIKPLKATITYVARSAVSISQHFSISGNCNAPAKRANKINIKSYTELTNRNAAIWTLCSLTNQTSHTKWLANPYYSRLYGLDGVIC